MMLQQRLCAVLLFAPISAIWAESNPPPLTQEAKARAGVLLEAGNERFDGGDYAAALRHFRSAYEVFPSPKILFNVGRALQKLGQDVDAAHAYERYLAESDEGDDSDKHLLARGALGELRERLAEVRVAVKPPKPRSVALRQESGFGGLKILGIALDVAGVALVATGTYYAFDASERAREVERTLGGCTAAAPCSADIVMEQEEAGRRSALASAVLISAGIALAVGGIVTLIVSLAHPRTQPIVDRSQSGSSLIYGVSF